MDTNIDKSSDDDKSEKSSTLCMGRSKSSSSPSPSPSIKKDNLPFFSWLRSPSHEKGLEIEKNLLELGEIPINDSTKFQMVDVVTLSDPSRVIHSIILDEQGVQDNAEKRKNIIFCHGFGAGLAVFFRNLKSITLGIDNSRIYAFDWLGMGLSSRPEFPKFDPLSASNNPSPSIKQAIDFFLDSFEDWRKQQAGLNKFYLVGHSMGGYLAALYALKYPERVEKLFMVSPVGLPEPSDPLLSLEYAITGHKIPSLIKYMWNANYTPQWLCRILGPFGPKFVQKYVEARFKSLESIHKFPFTQYLYHILTDKASGEYSLNALLAPGAWAREPLHNQLAQIKMNTIFIYGSRDWMDYRHAEQAAEKMTVPTKIIQINDADHQLYLDNPKEFNQVIIDEINNDITTTDISIEITTEITTNNLNDQEKSSN